MNFLSRMKISLARFMQGRNGADNLGIFTLLSGLVLSLTSSFTGLWILSLLSMLLYILTLFRMFSRNRPKRMEENRKYLALSSGLKTKITQFVKRIKNRKEYRYFRCPQCKVLLRMKRGSGEKDITCVRCGHAFRRKA